LLILLVSSCANKVAPTGGARDITPPKLKKAVPENLQINFAARKIELQFDEFVQLNDVENQLIISPLIFPKPVLKVSKKTVLVNLPDTLRPNTTYTINFGKSIADVHEKNIFENYQYVFSTGSILDSLQCTGKVLDAATSQPLKGLTVMLYRDSNLLHPDSAVFKKKPEYFTRTDSSGDFTIKNIAAGSYNIYSLDDKNSNYICDDPTEETMAFSGSVMEIPQKSPITLFASKQEAATLRFLKAIKVDRLKLLLTFSAPVADLTTTDFATTAPYAGVTTWTNNHDSLYVFLKDTLSDSLHLVVTNGLGINDTIALQMSSYNTTKTIAMPALKINVVKHPANEGPATTMVFEADRPLTSIGDKFTLLQDSVPLTGLTFHKDSLSAQRFSLTVKWKEGSKYQLNIPKGTLKDLYQLSNDTLKYNFTIPTTETTGVLTIKVSNVVPGNLYLLQLTDDHYAPIREMKITEDGSYTFNYLSPNSIRIRMIQDVNKNGKWDGASYGKGIQPEPVTATPSSLQIRANWELETEIFAPSN
jgi:uncharacterized protein (DUF2141 family)